MNAAAAAVKLGGGGGCSSGTTCTCTCFGIGTGFAFAFDELDADGSGKLEVAEMHDMSKWVFEKRGMSDEERAAAVEDAVQRLVAAGADEEDLRSTIAAAIHLGRRSAGD